MFGFEKRKVEVLRTQMSQLEERVVMLMNERSKLLDENDELKTENKRLSKKRQMEQEEVAHKLKMREEQVAMDAAKKIADAERKAAKDKDEGIAKVKDKYRDKLENQLEKRGNEIKEMYTEILARLPNINMEVSKTIKSKS